MEGGENSQPPEINTFSGHGEVGSSGVGGKISRRTFQRSHASSTPYSRPPLPSRQQQQQQQQGKEGWFSKLVVEPASRLLPTLFSPIKSLNLPLPQSNPSPSGVGDDDTVQHDDPEDPASPRNFKEHGTPTRNNPLNDHHEHANDQLDNSKEDVGLDEIEERLKHKFFSRHESERLIELLRSRTSGLVHEVKSSERIEAEDHKALSQKNMVSLIDKGNLQTDRLYQKTSETFQTSANEDVGSSPVEIAKAYMRSLIAPDHDRQKLVGNSSNTYHESTAKLPFPSATKSPLCWPGSIVQGDHGCFTPQASTARAGLSLFPRSCYSGANLSRSSFKFQSGSPRPSYLSPAGSKQISTPISSSNTAIKRRMSVLDDNYTSAGSSRRVRAKNLHINAPGGGRRSDLQSRFAFHTTSSDSLKDPASPFQSSLIDSSLKCSSFLLQPADFDAKESKAFRDSSRVHPQSSGVAQRILEHLDRTLPTPKEKSQELQIATGRFEPKSMTNCMDHKTGSNLFNYPRASVLGEDIGYQSLNTEKALVGSSSKKHGGETQTVLPPESRKEGTVQTMNKSSQTKFLQVSKSAFESCGQEQASTFSNVKGRSTSDFSFPVSFTSNAFLDPPPTPTIASAGKNNRASDEVVKPTGSFGSSSTSLGSSSTTIGTTSNLSSSSTSAGMIFSFGSSGVSAGPTSTGPSSTSTRTILGFGSSSTSVGTTSTGPSSTSTGTIFGFGSSNANVGITFSSGSSSTSTAAISTFGSSSTSVGTGFILGSASTSLGTSFSSGPSKSTGTTFNFGSSSTNPGTTFSFASSNTSLGAVPALNVSSNRTSEAENPTYTFGSSASSEDKSLVFRFGHSTASNGPDFSFSTNASAHIADTTTPNFSFGSDRENRISFKIC